jgi:ribosomal protein S18 acetylase RimI-like enzyme
VTAPAEIRHLRPEDVDALLAAEHLFDHAPRPDWARKFLESEDHHILIAYLDDEPAGFVSGVETTHPDKGTEMFLYELGVAEAHRRQGLARALVEELGRLAVSRGCYGMWVATEPANAAALSTYRASGSDAGEESVILTWEFAAADTNPGRI